MTTREEDEPKPPYAAITICPGVEGSSKSTTYLYPTDPEYMQALGLLQQIRKRHEREDAYHDRHKNVIDPHSPLSDQFARGAGESGVAATMPTGGVDVGHRQNTRVTDDDGLRVDDDNKVQYVENEAEVVDEP